MKQKINLRIIIISILAIVITTLGITLVYYELFQNRIRADLAVEARLLAETGIENVVDNEAIIKEDAIRITWISKDGKVLFDNDVAAEQLGNHIDRPEVQDAFEKGIGESIRESTTMNMKTFYYALLLDDGTVIRVATDARSIISVFIATFPVVLIIMVVIMILCVIMSHFLTVQLLQPIGEMADNLDKMPQSPVYKELTPFLDRIREQHDAILAGAKARQEFTANVSHELKTPITAISGYAELIENKMVDDDMQIKFAGDIRKNADRLVTLVNDIIRLSELDQTGYTPEFSIVNLYEIAEERVELLKSNAMEKQIQIELSGEKCELTASRGMMVELLDNLIQNAIRYNVPNGKVEVEIGKQGNKSVLMVSDTGIGIPKSEQERVFERFYRVDKSRSRETGGTGLGLSIVKHIVEIHEGTIKLESVVGKGTVITIEL